jgi:hypothetical protein
MPKNPFLLGCALALCVTSAFAEKIQPPPRPPGSNLVVLQPGLNPLERARDTRAHHGKVQKPVVPAARKPSDGDTKGFFFDRPKLPAH